MQHLVGQFPISQYAIRYSQFVPKLYNYCRSLGFERDRMMPSRAFCSDESQGYPVILLTQHFGTFPFDHGRVGGRVALDRHGPFAHHGEDLVIVQATHAGYDPGPGDFGVYHRPRASERGRGTNCGKIAGVLAWYRREYDHARTDIRLGRIDGAPAVFIDNALLDPNRPEGLFPRLERFVQAADPLAIMATCKAFAAAPTLHGWCGDGPPAPIGANLVPAMFDFRHEPETGPDGHDLLEEALLPVMPSLVTAPFPGLDAARYYAQFEFDRTHRGIQREPAFRGKNILFLSGVNIDVSPQDDHLLFPLTKFVPWAASLRLRDGTARVMEQEELFDALDGQSGDNPDRISFDTAIATMAAAETVDLPPV